MSTSAVSVVLLLFWSVCYILLQRKIVTAKIYFLLLVLMGSGGLFFNPLPLMGLYPDTYRFANILIFAFLMIIGLIPWFRFDKFMKRDYRFVLNERYFKLTKIIFSFSILCSLFSILYALPYSLVSLTLGAQNVRDLITSGDVLMPRTILTTLAVGFSSFSPVNVIFVFVSLLDRRLKKYTPFLIVASFSYIVTSFASAARDGFIFIPLTYIVFFLIFKKSLHQLVLKRLRRYTIIFGILLAIGFTGITLDRFYENRSAKDVKESIVYGTWGYFYQQPYVFDHRIETPIFHGFKRRLTFLEGCFGVEGNEYVSADSRMHQMFGTMYLEAFEIAGYSSLVFFVVIYVVLFASIINYHRRRRKFFPLLLSFCIYFYFTISGMFYFRFGGNTSEFMFYMMLLFSSFVVPDLLRVESRHE